MRASCGAAGSPAPSCRGDGAWCTGAGIFPDKLGCSGSCFRDSSVSVPYYALLALWEVHQASNVPPDLFFSLKGFLSHLYVEVPKQCCWQHSECSLAPGSPYFREMLGSLPGLCPVAAQLGACVLEHPDSCRNGVLHEAGTKVLSALLPPDCRLRLFMAQNSSGAGPCLLAHAHISLG